MKFKRANLPDWPTDPLTTRDHPSTELCDAVRITLHGEQADRELDQKLATALREPVDLVIHNDLDPDREHETDSAACWCAPTVETIDPRH